MGLVQTQIVNRHLKTVIIQAHRLQQSIEVNYSTQLKKQDEINKPTSISNYKQLIVSHQKRFLVKTGKTGINEKPQYKESSTNKSMTHAIIDY